MKKNLYFLPLLLLLVACNGDDDVVLESDIIGTWELVATLADPGDGSGQFMPNSGKRLTFRSNGTMISTVDFCSSDIPAISVSTFDTTEQIIRSTNCNASYRFNEQFLEIYFFCIEACGERYVRVQ